MLEEQGGAGEATQQSRALTAADAAKSAWENFESGMTERRQDFQALLPPGISIDRFIACATTAVQQNPDLLFADKRSLFGAIKKAAQDGLLPDGREGVITWYNTKVKSNGQERWEKVCHWNPMVYGIRKRARELDDIIIDAQVVCENDRFEREQGDNPHILHTPADLKSDPGKMVGAYAIFRKGDEILHREVMRESEIQATREQSRAKDSLMWTKFASEGWRKAVVRRGIKTVPVSPKLESIITRDDELFDFGQNREAPQLLTPPPPPPPAAPKPPAVEHKPETPLNAVPPTPPAPPSKVAAFPDKGKKQKDAAPSLQLDPEAPPAQQSAADISADWQEFLSLQLDEYVRADSAAGKQAVLDRVEALIQRGQEAGEVSRVLAETLAEEWIRMTEEVDRK